MENIRRYLEGLSVLTPEEWIYFSDRVERWSARKNEVLLPAGRVENHLSFLDEGIVRLWTPQAEKEVTVDFRFAHSMVTAYASFLTRQPSGLCLQALTPVAGWRLSHQHLQDIYRHTDVGQYVGRQAAETLFLAKAAREISLLTETAEERYRNLLAQQPQLIRHIPQKYLVERIH